MQRNKTLFSVIATVFILFVFFGLWKIVSSLNLVSEAVMFLESASGIDKIFAGVLLFFFSALSALLGFFSTAALIPVATIIFGNMLTFVILFTAWVFGGFVAYVIGQTIGYRIVGIFITKEKVDRFSREVQDPNLFLPALLFRLVTPAETGYVFGLVSYPIRRYLLITAIAELPFAIALVWGSDALVTSDIIQFSGLILGMVIIIAVAVYLSQRNLQTHLNQNNQPKE